MDNVEGFKNELRLIHEQIQKINISKQSSEFDSLISNLRDLLRKNAHYVDAVLDDPHVKLIQKYLQKCIATSFFFTEEYWARKITKNPFPQDAITDFPDYDEYQERTSFELKASSDKEVNKVLFVGSGPVPITPILLALKHMHVDCIDVSQEAFDLSTNLISKLGLEKYIHFFVTNILDFQSFDGYDVIWVAVLVGETNEEKTKVVRHLCKNLQKKQSLVLRTGYGPGRLLYPEVSRDDLEGFSVYITNETPFSGNIQTYYIQKLL